MSDFDFLIFFHISNLFLQFSNYNFNIFFQIFLFHFSNYNFEFFFFKFSYFIFRIIISYLFSIFQNFQKNNVRILIKISSQRNKLKKINSSKKFPKLNKIPFFLFRREIKKKVKKCLTCNWNASVQIFDHFFLSKIFPSKKHIYKIRKF